MTDKDYHGLKSHVSIHGLNDLRKSPAYYYYKHLSGLYADVSTPAMVAGSLVHTMVLQPDKLYTDWATMPDFGRSKQDLIDKAAWMEENQHKQAVKEDVGIECANIATAVKSTDFYKTFMVKNLSMKYHTYTPKRKQTFR